LARVSSGVENDVVGLRYNFSKKKRFHKKNSSVSSQKQK